MSHERYYLEDRLRVPFKDSLKVIEEPEEKPEQIFGYDQEIYPIKTAEPLLATGIPKPKILGY